LQEKIKIGNDETAGELHDRMKIIGAELVVKTIYELANGTVEEKRQETRVISEGEIKHAPKIFTETCKIDWNKTVDEIYNLIRGLSPYPCAFTYLTNKMLKVYRAKKEIEVNTFDNGSVHTDGKTFLKFACCDGFIHVTDIQLEGKKRMKVEDFLRGWRT
jgi:methionyl-tRNA formyltransferase